VAVIKKGISLSRVDPRLQQPREQWGKKEKGGGKNENSTLYSQEREEKGTAESSLKEKARDSGTSGGNGEREKKERPPNPLFLLGKRKKRKR